MLLYLYLQAIIGVVAGLLIAICTKKSEGLIYGALDKAGRITNIVLLIIYAIVSYPVMLLSLVCCVNLVEKWGVFGWIVSIICVSSVLICGLGLGFSVALRKKGKSVQSFIIQFAGLISLVLTFLMFAFFCDTL